MGFPGARLGLCRQLNMHNSPKTKRRGLLGLLVGALREDQGHIKWRLLLLSAEQRGAHTQAGTHSQRSIINWAQSQHPCHRPWTLSNLHNFIIYVRGKDLFERRAVLPSISAPLFPWPSPPLSLLRMTYEKYNFPSHWIILTGLGRP